MADPVKVKATQKGYYGHLRYPDDVFEINGKDEFSKAWMERVKPEEPLGEPIGESLGDPAGHDGVKGGVQPETEKRPRGRPPKSEPAQ